MFFPINVNYFPTDVIANKQVSCELQVLSHSLSPSMCHIETALKTIALRAPEPPGFRFHEFH